MSNMEKAPSVANVLWIPERALGKPPTDLSGSGRSMGSPLKEMTMLDAAIWKQDGTARKVVRYGGYDGVVVEVIQMTFYRHRVTNQLRIIYEKGQR